MSTTALRPLLYLKPPAAEDQVSPFFRGREWDVWVATRFETAQEFLQKREFRVGLIHWDWPILDALNADQRARCPLETHSHVNWIALRSRQSEWSSDISRMIAFSCYDYHTLPLDLDRLLVTIGHAYGMAEIAQCRTALQTCDPALFNMVGQAPAMRTLFQTIAKFAVIDLNVMIRGESGTGKELTAEAIHRLSPRRAEPFVAVNCGALPKDLIHAELFGYEKGAFTGADRRRVGRIEAAEGGTLFLDEIGDLPIDLQVNLLRFLQEKTIDRLGGPAQIPVDVRVIAATNADLERAVEQGRFREDLYYRLNVLRLDVPPLRERGDDIELLAHHLFFQYAKTINPRLRGFSQLAIEAIKQYPWPGNVREMVNRIQRSVVVCEGKLITPRDLNLDSDPPNCTLMTLSEARARAEKEAIELTLAKVRNNVSKAARRLSVSRVTLYRLMEIHSIDWQRNRTFDAA